MGNANYAQVQFILDSFSCVLSTSQYLNDDPYYIAHCDDTVAPVLSFLTLPSS